MTSNKNKDKFNKSALLVSSFQKMVNRHLRQLRLPVRLTALLLMTALLAPVIFFNQSASVRASSSYSASVLNKAVTPAPPVAAPPEAFAGLSSFDSIHNNAFVDGAVSSLATANGKILSGYESAANIVAPPTLPEGFENAVLPTFGERVGNAWSSLTADSSPALSAAKKLPNEKLTNDTKEVEPSAISTALKTSAAKETGSAESTDEKSDSIAADKEATAAEPSSEPNVESLLPPTTPGVANFDFNGDGKADLARFQSASNLWTIKSTSGTTTATLGSAGAIIVPADYDGDGKTDVAVWNQYSADWTINKSSGGSTTIPAFGLNGDIPVPAHYNGSGTAAELALFRPSNGTWYTYRISDGYTTSTQWGQAGDIPVPGDYNNDGITDIAVFRSSNGIGYWYILMPGNGGFYTYFQWGAGTDVPVPGDYAGDGRTDYAVYRPSNGTWYIQPTDNTPYVSKTWGNYGDQPVPADYDGDGKTDIAVWRPTSGVWYIVKSIVPGMATYLYDQLGIPGDMPVSSAYVKKVGGAVPPAYLAMARLSPKNATGGTNLYSRNFSWGTSLVNLLGRAGLDAGFGISYNSLVWTKEPNTNTMVFDADYSNVSPGFQMGFPVIEPSYYNPLTQQFSYLMVTPSGGRVEFRQTAASNVYETADSSYTQLTVIPGQQNQGTEYSTLLVRTTDGTMMTYLWCAGSYKLSEIKDRNGNFISIVHDQQNGLLTSMTDTLGRVVTVEYDSDFSPIAIKQDWKDDNGKGSTVSHTYATFTYTAKQISPNFGTMNVFGPSGGAYVKVLEQIVYPTGARTVFEYENKYGQVSKISNLAANGNPLNYVETNLKRPTNDTELFQDCPRLSETRNWVKNFNNDAPTVIHNTFTSNSTYAANSESLTPVDMTEVWMDNDPHAVHSKSYYYAPGNWAEGLPIGTIDIADGVQQRWTRAFWTQDDTSRNYKINPRVIESKVGDATNTKRTTMDYWMQPGSTTVSQYGLIKNLRVYDSNQTTVLKRAYTNYRTESAYIDRRMVGLPKEQVLYEGESTPVSMVTYDYDAGGFNDTNLQQNLSSVIRHDNTNYGASFVIGRGNATSITRCETPLSAPGSCINGITSNAKYNTAGGVVAQIDPLNRKVVINYEDSFNDTTSTRNTYAYPTKMTEAEYSGTSKNYSITQYRFDMGANVRAVSPAPNNATGDGKISERIFDSLGRMIKDSVFKDGVEHTYVKYEYPTSQNIAVMKSTISDTNNNGVGDTADEVVSETYLDGVGRAYRSRKPMSFDSDGNVATWVGQKTVYDITGNAVSQSTPTEMDANWNATNTDLTRGWQWTHQKYDWKGRVTRKINLDGIDSPTINDSDVLISYDGCGCAGGQVTTIKGELVPRDDLANANARRTQKIYQDIQGRTWKTEQMKWDEVTPYLTTTTTFNGRDQAVSVTKTNESAVSQTTTMTYDGFGRLETQHRPEQSVGTNTTYQYNADDKLHSLTDARGAKTTYGYNSRGLVNSVSYSVPTGSTIPVPAGSAFSYDALGNRTSMTDGLGNVSYVYDQLSQMSSETRQFNDTLPDAPLANNKFKLEYTYGISGQLLSYKDPYGEQINYTQDKVGRLNSVTGSTFGGVTNYASNPQYRAWGALKSLTYGDTNQMQMTYDSRLQASMYELTGPSYMKKNYTYYADGQLKFLDDYYDSNFDRLNIYDHTGRISKARSSVEASGGTTTTPQNDLPYRQDYSHDAFGNMTQRNNTHWGKTSYAGLGSFNLNYTFQNNRVTDAGWVYDADGRVTKSAAPDIPVESVFNAAGQLVTIFRGNQKLSNNSFLDEDGREIKQEKGWCSFYSYTSGQMCQQWENNLNTTYYIRSTVLSKQVISEARHTGKKSKTYVLAGKQTLARQEIYDDGYGQPPVKKVYFEHRDASGMSQFTTESNGYIVWGEDTDISAAEIDPLGGNVGLTSPYLRPRPTGGNSNGGGKPGPQVLDLGEKNFVNPTNPTMTLDGTEVPEKVYLALARVDALAILSDLGQGRAIATPAQEMFGGLFYVSSLTVRERPSKDPGFFLDPIVTAQFSWVDLSGLEQQTQDRESTNLRNFRSAADDARTILTGNNPCAVLFGTAGLAALDNLVNAVNNSGNNGEDAFVALQKDDGTRNFTTGIRMTIPSRDYPMNSRAPIILSLDGTRREYGATSPVSVAINTNGPFTRAIGQGTDRLPRIGNYGAGSRESRVLQILHELGHLVFTNRTPFPSGTTINGVPQLNSRISLLLPVDGGAGQASLSEANTTIVSNACREQINALSNNR